MTTKLIRDRADVTIQINEETQEVYLNLHDPKSRTGEVEREIHLACDEADMIGLWLIRNSDRLREAARQEYLDAHKLTDKTVVGR